MSKVSDTMSQENIWPAKVLILSMVSNIFAYAILLKISHPDGHRPGG
jgi:hypothetical protein